MDLGYAYEDFIDWIDNGVEREETIAIELIALIVILTYSFAAIYLANILNLHFGSIGITTTAEKTSMQSVGIYSYDFFVVLGEVAIMEEVFFRLFPLVLVVSVVKPFSRSYETPIKAALAASMLASVYFGFLHGGCDHVLLQGFDGMIFSVVFLKCGGAQGSSLRGWMSSTRVHFLVNLAVFSVDYLSGYRYVAW